MTPEQRASIENGIWLCSKHATLIDRDTVRFTVEVLRRWRADHETYVEEYLGEIRPQEATPTLGGRAISSEAARIAAERTLVWEQRLFGQLLRDEIRKSIDDVRHLQYGVTLGQITSIEPDEIVSKIRHAMAESEAIVKTFITLINGPLKEAFGSDGQAGDPELLEYVAHSLGELHRVTLRWGLVWLHTRCPLDEADALLALMPELMREVQAAFTRIPDQIDETCEAAVAALSPTAPKFESTVTITLTIPERIAAQIVNEVQRLGPLLADAS